MRALREGDAQLRFTDAYIKLCGTNGYQGYHGDTRVIRLIRVRAENKVQNG